VKLTFHDFYVRYQAIVSKSWKDMFIKFLRGHRSRYLDSEYWRDVMKSQIIPTCQALDGNMVSRRSGNHKWPSYWSDSSFETVLPNEE
jgi:hypothetical protein